MKFIFFQICCFVFGPLSLCSNAQRHANNQQSPFPIEKNKLEIISNPPIKVDGGCSFFSFSNVSLETNKPILIISLNKIALIKYKGIYLYFKRTERKEYVKGYVDKYHNKDYWLILKVNNIRKIEQHTSIRTGTLTILNKMGEISFDVKGLVEEFDKYNHMFLEKAH